MRDAWARLLVPRRNRWLLAGALLGIFVLLVWRDSISERLVPDPRMNQRLEQAQFALRAGRLSSEDGKGARQLFESVLATDPDQMLARRGLVDVRDAALRRAQLSLEGHRLAQARQDLQLAAALSAPASEVQALETRLNELEQAIGDIPSLLASAHQPGLSDDAALALYARALQLDAANAPSLEGRSEILSNWLRAAETLIHGNRIEPARLLVERVIAVDPGHLDLPPVQASLGEALARQQHMRANAIASAEAEERAGRIDRAGESYLRLAVERDAPPEIAAALHRLAVRKASQAQREAADFKFRHAEASLAKARKWSPGAPEVLAASEAVQQSRIAQSRLAKPAGRESKSQLAALAVDARDAMARGDFISSPGTSAWDKLRLAMSLSAKAPQVSELRSEFRAGARACFDKAMAAGQLTRAQSCLDAALALDPVSPKLREGADELAGRWLAYAEERIGASDYVEAEQAIAAARRWQPGHSKLASLTLRLRQARGAQ